MVYWLGKPAVIRDEEIQAIQAFLEEYNGPDQPVQTVTFEPGESLRVKSGSFQAQEGTVVRQNRQKVTLQLEQLGMALGARGVPTTVFMKADGTPIAHQPGYIKRPMFLQMIRYVGSGAYENKSFKAFRKRSSE
jgi:uncharacterized protein (AIM24 family)